MLRTGRSSAAVLAALVLGLFWCVEGIDVNAPQLDRVVLLLAGLALAWAALRGTPFVAGSTAYYAVLVAASERLHRQPLLDGSDVMRATAESLDVVFAEREGRWSRGAFVLSAVCFGWAIAFKQFALLVLPPVVRYVAVRRGDWRRYALIVAGVTAAFILPFFVRDPGAFVEKQMAALTFHDEIWGANILNTLAQYGDPTPLVALFTVISLAGTLGLVVLVARWRVPTLGAAALAGAGIVMVPLLLARWTTQPYFVYVGAIAACGVALLASRIRSE